MNQTLLGFEQATVDAEASARAARLATEELARAARTAKRETRKAEAEAAKSWRRFQRDAARRERTPDEHAQCGIRWYCRSPRDRDRGSYWTHCHACGQALVYTADRNATPQECKPRPA